MQPATLALALLGLTAGSVAHAQPTSTSSPTVARAGSPELFETPFSVQADRLEASPRAGRYVARGHVEVRRPGAALFADEVVFDEAKGLAYASGHVVAVDGGSVLTCDKVTMRIPELFGGLEDAELRIKSKGTIQDLPGLPPTRARRAGKDELIVTADRLERRSRSEIAVKGASFTACDCGEGNRPSWRIWSKDASIDLDSGAWLTLPVFYVLDVPVMALPVFYVPLGARRSGVLTPRFGYVSNTGFRLGLPYFIAISRSWDATVEPYYLSERGAGLDLELRYSPSRTTRGVWRPSVVADLGVLVDGQWDKSSDLLLRWAVAGEHDTRWSRSRLRAEVNLMGDPAYQGDFANAFLSRQAEFTRTRLTYNHRVQDNLRFSGGLQLLQDLRPDTYAGSAEGGSRDVELFSGQIGAMSATGFTGAGSVRYRFADLVLDAAPMSLWSAIGLVGQARLAVSTFAAPRPELARFARADLRPELSAAIDLPLGVVLEPSVAGRFTAWAGRGDRMNVDATRLTMVARTRLSMDLLRDFGPIAHRIRPILEHVLVPGFLGADTAPGAVETEDEIDALAAVHQVRARLDTELLDPRTGARRFGIETWLGRDLEFRGDGGQTSELVAKADLHLGQTWPVRLDLFGTMVLRLEDPVVTEARARARISDRRGDSLSVTWARLDQVRPEYSLIGLEELVPSGVVRPDQYLPYEDWAVLPTVPPDGPARQDFRPWSAFTGVTLSARARPVEPLTLGFDITLSFDDDEVVERVYGAEGTPSLVRNTRAMVGWASTCDCWSAYVSVSTARDREGVQVDFGLDLARLGSVGAP